LGHRLMGTQCNMHFSYLLHTTKHTTKKDLISDGINSVGLMYDGVGVVALGFALFLKSVKAMVIESGTYFGGNNALLESLIQQRTDVVAGTSFLVVGFFLQFLGSPMCAVKMRGKSLLSFSWLSRSRTCFSLERR
ncbi:MAG: hypothetical protein AAB300_03185, partial [Nitrospirota bacterium]